MNDSQSAQTRPASSPFRLLWPWLAIAALLTVPFIAMQFDNGVDWTTSDFVVMGLLMGTAVLAAQLLMRLLPTRRSRLIALAVVAVLFLYVWAELAVGIFNIPGISGS